ncbi:MAG TPA: rod shape-determining protein MreD [Methylomirabilota bacterium]
MKALAVLGAIGLALVLQTTLGRFLVLGTAPLDLVLIVVVYVGLTSGPTTGLLAGTCAGLAQDALSSGTLGIGGLAKTIVGYLVGLAGTQFIVVGVLPRLVTFVAATVLHAVIFMGLYELLNLRDFGLPYGAVLGQGLANALVGIVLLQAVELLPGVVERRQGRGRQVSRRLD